MSKKNIELKKGCVILEDFKSIPLQVHDLLINIWHVTGIVHFVPEELLNTCLTP